MDDTPQPTLAPYDQLPANVEDGTILLKETTTLTPASLFQQPQIFQVSSLLTTVECMTCGSLNNSCTCSIRVQ